MKARPSLVADLADTLAFYIKAEGLPPGEREYRGIEGRRFRFDLAWVEEKLAVEVDGGLHTYGRHNRAYGIESDCEKQCLAVVNGWRVLRVTKSMIESGHAVKFIREALKVK